MKGGNIFLEGSSSEMPAFGVCDGRPNNKKARDLLSHGLKIMAGLTRLPDLYRDDLLRDRRAMVHSAK